MKRKVLYVIDAYDGGGGEKALEAIVHYGIRSNSQFGEWVCTLREPAYFSEGKEYPVVSLSSRRGPKHGTDSRKIKALFQGLRMLPATFKLVELIREEQFDIVMAIGFPASLICALASIVNSNTIFIYRASYQRSPKVYFFERPFMEWIYSRFDCILCISDFVKDSMSTPFPRTREKLFVIRNGLDIEIEEKYPKREASSIDGITTYVNSGRFVPIKDQEFLIEAFSKVAKNTTNCRLLLLGDGPTRPYLERKVKDLGLSDHITFCGHVVNPIEILIKSDIYLHACKAEGFGISVLEAMGVGLPVIAFNSGAMPELIENNREGILIPNERDDMFIQAMQELGEKPSLRNTLAENAFRKARESFSMKKTVDEYDSIYSRLLMERRL